ncbi:unnamed protein product [Durusdinium trenchii]|uniref:Right handed beta helix domain-containing protein n=1 Tax=Durusdinium trenchii TaxID=1381693 RepID=A0ABP0JMC2_9DINO
MLKMLRKLKPLDPLLDAAKDEEECEGEIEPATSRTPALRKRRSAVCKPARKTLNARRRVARFVTKDGGEPERRHVAVAGRPLARQVDDALKCKADRLLLTSSGLGNGEKEVVSKSITIEATPGLPLPAILNCGLATRQPGRGPQTVLTLRRVRLQRPDQSQPLLEVGAGTACELYDCFVEGGIKLCEGARAKLIRTQIQGFGGAGISGRAFNCLSLLACTISDCADDGLLLRHGKADVVDCTINNSGQSGLVFGPGQWQLMGSTVSGSGQYGLWAEADAMVSCRDNVFADNALGDTGGRGVLKGWRAGFGLLPDSQCRVWCEQRAKWLPGRVVAVTDQVAVAVAKRFRKAKLGEESKVPPSEPTREGQSEQTGTAVPDPACERSLLFL